MVLNAIGQPLVWTELPDRIPGRGEIRVNVLASGVCRTDLHVVDGELSNRHVPIIPGHAIVGRIDALGDGVTGLAIGERVGIPSLGHTCGACPYCRSNHENLCDAPHFTGHTRDGGYASAVIADARFAFPLGEQGGDVMLAPLLCAGLIGWRSLVMADEAARTGFYAFVRTGDTVTQAFAKSLGAVWAGTSEDSPSDPLDISLGPVCGTAPRWKRPCGARRMNWLVAIESG
jgi:propanol-preferring alcohol dehydrogenase